MAKTLTIKDPVSGESYTLEYTRKTVEIMEKQGFIADDVDRKPMTMLPALFAGAFLAHHRWVKKDVIDRIYARLPRKTSFFLSWWRCITNPFCPSWKSLSRMVMTRETWTGRRTGKRVAVQQTGGRWRQSPRSPFRLHGKVLSGLSLLSCYRNDLRAVLGDGL